MDYEGGPRLWTQKIRSLRSIRITGTLVSIRASILTVGVIDTRRAIGASIGAIGIRRGIRSIGIGAQSSQVRSILSDNPWCLC